MQSYATAMYVQEPAVNSPTVQASLMTMLPLPMHTGGTALCLPLIALSAQALPSMPMSDTMPHARHALKVVWDLISYCRTSML
jgi:hypothetical protein